MRWALCVLAADRCLTEPSFGNGLLHNVSLGMLVVYTVHTLPCLEAAPGISLAYVFPGFIGRLQCHRLHEFGPATIEAAVKAVLQVRHKHILSVTPQTHRHFFDPIRRNAMDEVGLSVSLKLALRHLVPRPLRRRHVFRVGGLEACCNVGKAAASIRREVRIRKFCVRHRAWIVDDLWSKI